MTQPIRILLLGAGNRGTEVYGNFIKRHPVDIRIAAVAEPNPQRRERCAEIHHIPAEHQFESWENALAVEKVADAVINATPDDVHHDSAVAALQAGYNLLLEKPIATTLSDTLHIVKTAQDLGRKLMVCHVLRYTSFFKKAHEIIRTGRLGQVIHISHSENVAYFHMAHSYVRGNWRNTSTSAPMILAKCCHDLDLLTWFLGEPCAQLSSMGGLRHFRPENAPYGAPSRCTDGCPAAKDCPFYAPRIYIDNLPIKHAVSQAANPLLRLAGKLTLQKPKIAGNLAAMYKPMRHLVHYQGWPRNTITDQPESDAAVWEALKTGPYGRCVYHCDNNVVDHQSVQMAFPSGVTATLIMHGHAHEEARTLRVDGSQATLLGKFSHGHAWLEIHGHGDGRVERFTFPTVVDGASGHGGGDDGVMHQFVKVMQGDSTAQTPVRESLESHLLAFAAEKARLEGQIINMEAFRRQLEPD